jgi:hypothetical protein
MRTYKLHISDIQRYKSCRQAWSWASPLKANLTPRDKYQPFFTGSLMHHVLEYHYKFGTSAGDSIRAYIAANCDAEQQRDPALLDQARLVASMFNHYQLWQKQDRSWLADANFAFISAEQDFTVPLWRNQYAACELVGTFDGVVQNITDNKYYLWELKTTRSIAQREKQLDLDSQADAYTNAAQRILGVPISGIIYTLMRKDLPDFPKINKDGFLSASTSQDTTAFWYLKCIKEHHGAMLEKVSKEDQDLWIKHNYGTIINALLQQDQKYFRRVLVQRSQIELANSWQELRAVTNEMLSRRTPVYLNESYSCNYCLFRNPCIAKRAGRDYQHILDRDYVFNQRYADEIEV